MAKAAKTPDISVIIDTREQAPVLLDKEGDPEFPGLHIEFGTLKTGDYSIVGMSDPARHQHSITIERKSLADLFGSTGRGRARLEKEFIRMSEFDVAEFVVEGDLRQVFLSPPPLSQMLPKSVYRTVLAFSQRYRVIPWFCPNRAFAEKHIYLSLMRFYTDRQQEGIKEFCKI
jgi:ERCC4-type nuclease